MDFNITLEDLPNSGANQGLSLGLFPGLENTLDAVCPEGCWGSFELETPQDLLTVNVVNHDLEERSFMLKLFYNYEEVAFQVLGSEEFRTELLFELDAQVEANIHLQLEDDIEIDENKNKLTVSLFSLPEYYAGLSDWEIVDEMTNMIINFELTYGFENGNLLHFNPSMLQTQTLSVEGWYGVHIIDSPDPDDPDNMIFTDSLVQGDPGETLDFGFLVDFSDATSGPLESFLLFALLDWQQVNMSDLPYILVSIDNEPDSFVNYGRFSITLPEEPGLYELILVGSPNPDAPNTQENYFPLDYSQRITIQVD